MTVSSSTNRNDYAGNGSTTSFAVSFRFLQNSDIKATLRDALSTETLQVETTDYTLTGAGGAGGGTLVMIVAPPSGTTLTIQRDVPATQETDYVENDEFPAESHEDALDKLTMLVQQQGEDSTRHIGFSDTVSDATGLAVELSQDATQRADKFLGFDSTGNIATKTASVAGLVDQGQQDNRYGVLFATLAAMTAANPVSLDGEIVSLVAGMQCRIVGRPVPYNVVASTARPLDNGLAFALDNGLFAEVELYGDYINLSMFGPLTPGGSIVTVLQAAADSGEKNILIPYNSTGYVIDGTVTADNIGLSLFSPGRGYYRTPISSSGATFDMFDVNEGEFSASGIRFLGDGTLYGAGATVNVFNFDGTGLANVDAHIHNCAFQSFATIAKVNGRNVDMQECLFSNSLFGVVAKSVSPPSDFRGLVLKNNRFHSMGLTTEPTSICVSVPGAANFKELIVTNNYCDDSAVFFDGFASEMSVSANRIFRGVGGIKVDSAGHGISALDRQIAVDGNQISMQSGISNDRHGIEITNASSRGTLNGNTVANAGKAGIKGTAMTLMTAGGNTIANASKDNAGVNDAIELDASSTLNNIGINTLVKGTNTRKGISVAGANNVVGRQIFSGFAAADRIDITDDSTGYEETVKTKNSGWGDADTTLIVGEDEQLQRHSTTITADRNVALSLTNVYDGAVFRILRVSGGAFNLNIRNATVGGTLIKAVAANEWVEATYIESTAQWLLTSFGST